MNIMFSSNTHKYNDFNSKNVSTIIEYKIKLIINIAYAIDKHIEFELSKKFLFSYKERTNHFFSYINNLRHNS